MPRALNIPAAAPSADRIFVGLVDFGANRPSEGEVTIKVRAAGVNPGDAKAMLASCRTPSSRARRDATSPAW
jgi:NADPH:quinone reductase-like Zn-dependent oxidoreductase